VDIHGQLIFVELCFANEGRHVAEKYFSLVLQISKGYELPAREGDMINAKEMTFCPDTLTWMKFFLIPGMLS